MQKAREGHDRVLAVIQDNAASLLRLARAHSLCADDAQDAYQRALEIYLERLDGVDAATEASWLRTVVKHEAMRIRASRQRLVPDEDVDLDAHPSPDVADAGERMAGFERVARAAEALQGCRPDEVRALLLKADGSSYSEIGELLGWSYTKVNRCLTEGRARFLRRFADIDSGAACERWQPVLCAVVDGDASPDDMAALRPHLRHCSSCRAALRSLYEAQPALGAVLPAGLLAAGAGAAGGGDAGGIFTRALEAAAAGLGERVVRAQAAFEALTSAKAVAVVASTAAIAGGGAVAAEQGPGPAPSRAAAVERAERTVRRADRAPNPARPPARPAPAAAAAAPRAEAPPRAAAPRARDASGAARPSRQVRRVRREFAFEAPAAPQRPAPAVRRPAAPERPAAAAPQPPARERPPGEFGFEG